MGFSIRKAKAPDLLAINNIYTESALHNTATFDTQAKTLAERKAWFEQHGDSHPILVAEKDQEIVGWASLSLWSERAAYGGTAEISLYIASNFHRQGIGKKLMTEILRAGQNAGLHTVLARITAGNEVSLKLHYDFGFSEVGVLKEVGKKFGKLLDVHLLQKMFDE